MKLQVSRIALGEDAVEHAGVKMHIQIQSRASPLHHAHRPGLAAVDIMTLGSIPVEAQKSPEENLQHRAGNLVVPGEFVPERKRETAAVKGALWACV